MINSRKVWPFDTHAQKFPHRDGLLSQTPPGFRSAPSKTVSCDCVEPDAVPWWTERVLTLCHLPTPAGLEELWWGISFVPLEGTLSWEPACRVAAEVSLCQRREDGVCVDLPHSSQNASREKVLWHVVAVVVFVLLHCETTILKIRNILVIHDNSVVKWILTRHDPICGNCLMTVYIYSSLLNY